MGTTYFKGNKCSFQNCALNMYETGMSCFTRFSSVQFRCSVVFDSATPWTAARQTSLSITNARSLLKLMSTESVMPSNLSSSSHPHLITRLGYKIMVFLMTFSFVLTDSLPRYPLFARNVFLPSI